MTDASSLKALCHETKALIIVSEFEARRMPMFQLRAVLGVIVKDDEERKHVIDLVESDLKATGYQEEQISTFLTELLASAPAKLIGDPAIHTTRRLRSPFTLGFEANAHETSPVVDKAQPMPARGLTGIVSFPSQLPTSQPANAMDKSPEARSNINVRNNSNDVLEALTPPPPDFTPLANPLHPPPPPAAATPARRGSQIFDLSKQNPTSNVPSAPSPATPDMLLPVGQKTFARHTMIFGGENARLKVTMGTRPLILIADDDKRIRMVFRLRIEEAGYDVVECGDGNEAWERIQQGELALIVLDMKMPGLHGLEVLSRMVDKQLKIPVIVCSAYDQLEDEFVVQTYPSLRYLVKPISPETLVNTIKELLAVVGG